MNLFIAILGQVLSLLGVLAGIIGDTWDKNLPGMKKLRPTGWVAGSVAIVGVGLSCYASIHDYHDKKAYQAIAMGDVGGGWRQLVSPWSLALWEITGEKTTIDVETLGELKTLHLERLASLDLSKPTPVKQYGGKSLGRLFCEQTSTGMRIIERSVDIYRTMLDAKVIERSKAIRQSSAFGKLLAAGCGTRDTGPNYGLFDEIFSTGEVIQYLELLQELGILLQKYQRQAG